MSNILSAKIQVTAPGVQQTFNQVAGGTDDLNKALDKLGKQGVLSIGGIEDALKQLKQVLSVTTDPKDISKLNTAISALQTRLTGLKTGGAVQEINHTQLATQRASSSILNLSKTFGVLNPEVAHVAHSFEPLFNVFEQLQHQTGSTGKALKSFGSLIFGPVGLGLALSIGAGLLVEFGHELFGASEKTKEAEEAAKKYKDAVKGIFSETAKEATQVATLVGLLKSETETRERKLSAIKELQKIEPEIFQGLKLEGDAVIGLDAAYVSYIKNLSTVIAVKLKQQQLEGLITKQLELQGATLTKTQSDFINKLKQANDVLIFQQKLSSDKTGNEFKVATIQEEQNKKALEQKTLQADIAGIISDISELSKGVKLPGIKDAKAAKDIKFEYDALKAIFKDLIGLQKEFSAQIDAEVKARIKIKADFSNGAGSAFDDFSKQIPAVSAELQKEVDRLTKGNIILKLGAQFTLDMTAANDNIKKQLQGLNDTFRDTVGDVFGNIGETLGEALSGGDLQKGIQSLFSAIASGIQSIGKQFIKIGVLALLAKDAFKKLFSNPALSIAVGIALVAAGAALKNSLGGSMQGRAGGGRVNKGQPYIVGEVGKEIFVPDTGGTIVPNNKIAAAGSPMQGGGGMVVRIVGEFVQRGNDLVAAIANTNRAQGRLT